jgi:acetyl/propionyl-CoA carboxylase alpha subunit
VLEEAPAFDVDPALQAELEAARGGCWWRRVRGGRTVELLLAPDGSAYFLEVNARLQVEHPVTELVTGEDLVAWQLRIAGGERLPPDGLGPAMRGHAIEARLVAEDPDAGFLPAAGPLLRLDLPQGECIRVDAGYRAGNEVSPYYDGLLAKVCATARPGRGPGAAGGGARRDGRGRRCARMPAPCATSSATPRSARPHRHGYLERTWTSDAPGGRTRSSARSPWRARAPRPRPPAPARSRGASGLGLANRRRVPRRAWRPTGALHVLVEGRDVRVPADEAARRSSRSPTAVREPGAGAARVAAVMPGRVAAVRVAAGDAVAARATRWSCSRAG